MANDLTFTQISTILNSIVKQATGQNALAATNSYEFVNQAQTALLNGYDPVFNAISQVIKKTVFSVRPYTRKFKGLEKSETQWGAITRKLSIADNDYNDDDAFKWPVAYDATQTTNPTGNGQSVDHYTIKKSDILQTNFYGHSVYSDHYTIFKNQIDVAFSSPEEFAQFITMITTNFNDRLEQARESLSRATVANLIGGVLKEGQTGRTVHLITEYNALTGLELTATDIYKPANFKAFIQWAYSRINTVSEMFTERSTLYQTTINSKYTPRHTPKSRQQMYIYAPANAQIGAMALADTYHDSYLKLGGFETVNYWQSIKTPDSINLKPSYTGSNGAVVNASTAVSQANIFGVLFDTEAAGTNMTASRMYNTPFNARGEYTNTWLHETQRCFNDFTEKSVVFLLN